MKKMLNFLKKYWLCFALSIIMVMGIDLTTLYADLYISGSGDDISFNLRELYLIFGLPLYSLIYGCLSFIKTKKILVPLLILFVISFIHWFRFDIGELTWAGTYIWSALPVVFSLIGTIITVIVYCFVEFVKSR